MSNEKKSPLDTNQLAMVFEKVPAGITVIDQEGHKAEIQQLFGKLELVGTFWDVGGTN